MASPTSQYFFGTPAQAVRVDRFGKPQIGLQENITERIQNLLGQNPSFEPIAQQARQQYQEQSLPALKNQFSTPGASSAYQNAVSRGASNLETNLAALQSNYNIEQQKQIPALGKLALEPQFETIYEPAEQGAVQDLFGQLAPIIGQKGIDLLSNYLGGTAGTGNVAQNIAGGIGQAAGQAIGGKTGGAIGQVVGQIGGGAATGALGAQGAAALAPAAVPAAVGGAVAATPAVTGAAVAPVAAGKGAAAAAGAGVMAKIAPVVAKALPVAVAAAVAYAGYRFVKKMAGTTKKEDKKYKARKARYLKGIAKQKAAKKAAKSQANPAASPASPSTPVVKKSAKPKQNCPGGVCPLKKKK